MELNLKEAFLKKLIVHYVGSKNNLEPVYLSDTDVPLAEETALIVGQGLLNKFSNAFEQYKFHHASSLQFNEVYNYATELFSDTDSFTKQSISIARQLYESSTHPKVKGGELYLAFFEGLPVEGRVVKALGVFKTENKTQFLQTAYNEKKFSIQLQEGVELAKVDKGCLILNQKKEDGFDVLIFDNQNRGEEAMYWKEKFLGLVPHKNEFHQTNHFLTLTKQYITEQLNNEFQTPKTEQIELLHKSMDYFRNKESFDIDEFQKEVFEQDTMIESFRNYGSRYTEKYDFDIAAQFDISGQAVKKQMRIYKSVLKLDRNFHIYIHGNTDLIEKGVDLDGRKYYKIYYQDEA